MVEIDLKYLDQIKYVKIYNECEENVTVNKEKMKELISMRI